MDYIVHYNSKHQQIDRLITKLVSNNTANFNYITTKNNRPVAVGYKPYVKKYLKNEHQANMLVSNLVKYGTAKNIKIVAKHYWWGYTKYKLQLRTFTVKVKGLHKNELIYLNQRPFGGQNELVINNLVPGRYVIKWYKHSKQKPQTKIIDVSGDQEVTFRPTVKKVRNSQKTSDNFDMQTMQNLFANGFKSTQNASSGTFFVHGKQSPLYQELKTIFATYRHTQLIKSYQFKLKVIKIHRLSKQQGVVTYWVTYRFIPKDKGAKIHQQVFEYQGQVSKNNQSQKYQITKLGRAKLLKNSYQRYK